MVSGETVLAEQRAVGRSCLGEPIGVEEQAVAGFEGVDLFGDVTVADIPQPEGQRRPAGLGG